jgi:hypothetical protein
MRSVGEMTFLLWASLGLLIGPRQIYAQACKDETTMVEGSRQDLVGLTTEVKEESLPKFEAFNHQKAAMSKLSMHDGMLGELITCLDKAAQDTTLAKEDVAAAKTQHDACVKLREKIKHAESALKGAKTPQDAKSLIASLDLAP